MKLGLKQKQMANTYDEAKPKERGNLHERMKFVVKALDEARGWRTSEPDPEFDQLYHDLVFGIFDLETEVKFYEPVRPPYAQRSTPTSARH